MKKEIKIALVHDFLIQQGGAERVLKVLSDMYPEAPIYTLLYDKEKMRGMFKDKDIRPSYLQKLPLFFKKRYRWLLPFFPTIPETFDLREYDLVISSSGAWSKGIVTKLNTIHVAYLHSPMRFVWDYNERYLSENRKEKFKFLFRFVFSYLRVWDNVAAQRPDYVIANSQYTQRRIKKYYHRESSVIYSPVETYVSDVGVESDLVDTLKDKKYFIVVSRLSAYKKIDIVIEAFNKLELPLVIVGEGNFEKHLKSIAKPNIIFAGWRSDASIQTLLKNAQGFIFPTEDDFGIAPVEAMLCGTPVIALRKGGACETVQEGVTGEFFDAQTPEVLSDGIRRFMLKKDSYKKEEIINRGQEFSRERFEKEFGEYINEIMQNTNLKMHDR